MEHEKFIEIVAFPTCTSDNDHDGIADDIAHKLTAYERQFLTDVIRDRVDIEKIYSEGYPY